MTLLDLILIAIMLVSALLAMVRGFSREVLSIIAWLAAAIAAFLFYEPLTPYAAQYIDSQMIAMIAAAGVVFLVTLIVVSFITLKIADFIIDSRVGALDRALGFVFGAVRGLLLVVVAMLFFNWLSPENQPTWIAQAQSKPMLDNLGRSLVAALPDNPERMILDRVPGVGDGDEGADEAADGSNQADTVEGAIDNAEGGNAQ